MSATHGLKCACCDGTLERVRYFPRQLLTADDMRAEQEYAREKFRRHNRYLHGWGVVCGCTVEPITDASSWQVRVCPGYAVGPQGDEIWIDQCIDVDLKTGPLEQPCSVRWPCPPVGEMPGGSRDQLITVYVAARYAECASRPVKVHPAGCGCDETGCEYSRTRDSFEIKVLWKLPKSHEAARADDTEWCNTVKQRAAEIRRHLFPVPPCPECVEEPWVVLAAVTFPRDRQPGPNNPPAQLLNISYVPRRVLLATQRLQVAMACLP